MTGAFPKGLYLFYAIRSLVCSVRLLPPKQANRASDALWLNALFLAVSTRSPDHRKLATVLSEITASAGYTFCTFVFITHRFLVKLHTWFFFPPHGLQMKLTQPESHQKIFLNARPASTMPEYKNPAGSLHLLKCTR